MDFVVEVGDVGERVDGGVKADSQHQKQKQTTACLTAKEAWSTPTK